MPRKSNQRGRLDYHHGSWRVLFWVRDSAMRNGWRRRQITLRSATEQDAEKECLPIISEINHMNRGEVWDGTVGSIERRSVSGVVYLIEAVGRNVFKVGVTSRDASLRLNDMQTGCPDELRVILEIPVEDMLGAEKLLHSALAQYRLRGEWFSLSESELRAKIAAIVPSFLTTAGHTPANQ
jgi:hypothetical protein